MTAITPLKIILTIIGVCIVGCQSSHAENAEGDAKELRKITKVDIEKLPDKLTVTQLFKIWYPVHLPDPPLFMYPSDIEDHLYFVAAHPEDADDLARGNYESVRVRSIYLFKYTYKTKLSEKPAWGEAPLIDPVIKASSDPFSEHKEKYAEQGSTHQSTTAP